MNLGTVRCHIEATKQRLKYIGSFKYNSLPLVPISKLGSPSHVIWIAHIGFIFMKFQIIFISNIYKYFVILFRYLN